MVSCVGLLFPCPSFCENLLSKKRMVSQSKVKVNVLNLSDKVKNLDLLKSGMSLAEVEQCYGKKESNFYSVALNSLHPEQSSTGSSLVIS
jgi:hypothetical protein